jgi:branched-chain amino acid transport system substrate-binding protein
VRARWLCLAVLALSPMLAAGCGSVVISGTASTIGNQLTIYSSLPLQGVSAAISKQIVDGERLALAESHGQIGRFKISYDLLDDSSPKTGEMSPGETSNDAKIAAQDASTIAYLGDYQSAATAISLPVTNAAGILQISPASPYVGLTSSLDAGQDEPERFYLTGKRTFASLMPADPVQAAAQVKMMRSKGIRRLYVLSDEDPFQVPLSEIVAGDARAGGIEVLAVESLNTTGATSFQNVVEKVIAGKAQAVFFSGAPTPGTIDLFRQLYDADHSLRLFGSSALVNPAFTAAIAGAAHNTLLGTPILPTRLYPAAAQRVLGDYRRRFGYQPHAYALYGYEVMSSVLAAIRAAGRHGNDREAVVKKFFQIHNRYSVLGLYSVKSSGQTTITRYGFDRIHAGKPVFYRALEVK